jgi:hypothetical protein
MTYIKLRTYPEDEDHGVRAQIPFCSSEYTVGVPVKKMLIGCRLRSNEDFGFATTETIGY